MPFTFFKDNYLEEITGEIEGMRVLLKKVKAIWIQTIWVDELERHNLPGHGEIRHRLLDGMVISCEEHFIKPEKEIYLRLRDKYGLKPSECLFTDDRMVNVLGAKAIGMEAVLFTTPKEYIFEIERICGIKIEQ